MTFRPLLITRIYARFAPPAEYIVNITPLFHPNPPQPFVQRDWPRTTDLQKLKVVGEPIGRVMPLLTPNPAQPFIQSLWESAIRGFPKVVGEVVGTLSPLLTPNPSIPFNQYEWRSAARVPLSLKSDVYFGAFSLYSPNPSIPFNQDLWENAARTPPRAVGEPLAGISALLTPNPAQPFTQLDWFQIRSTQKAKVDDFVNLAPLPVIAVVGLPPGQSAFDRTARTPSTAVPTEQQNLLSSTLAPAFLFRAPGIARVAERPTKANVDDPFNLTINLPPVAVNYILGPPLYARLPDAWAKAKVDDPFNLTIYLPTIVVTVVFKQLDWPLPARQPAKQADTSVAAFSPLFTPNPAQPFVESIWDSATRAYPKIVGEAVGTLSPLLTPNPARPFGPFDWFQIRSTQKAKVDDPYNATIIQPVVVVTFTISQLDWPNVALPRPKANVDNSIAASAPLYYPNPAQPFSQSIWDSATRAWAKAKVDDPFNLTIYLPTLAVSYVLNSPLYTRLPDALAKAKVDDFVNLRPLYTVVVVQPPFYYQDDRWSLIARAPAAQKSDVYRGSNALLSPNPAQPFNQDLWESAARLPPLKSIGDVLASPNPIIYPNPSQPFRQGDWPSNARQGPSDRSFALGINLPLITPPVVVTGLPHNQPFINASVGRMFGR